MSDFKALAKEAHRMEVGFREAIGYDDGDADLARSVIADELARFTTALDTAADLLGALQECRLAVTAAWMTNHVTRKHTATIDDCAVPSCVTMRATADRARTALARAIPKEEGS